MREIGFREVENRCFDQGGDERDVLGLFQKIPLSVNAYCSNNPPFMTLGKKKWNKKESKKSKKESVFQLLWLSSFSLLYFVLHM